MRNMCYYTGRHGGNQNDLCAWGNGHAWKRATQARYYMCAKVIGQTRARRVRNTSRAVWGRNNLRLGAKNGVPSRTYSFRQMRYLGSNGNNYSQTSIKGCARNGAGWKPVC